MLPRCSECTCSVLRSQHDTIRCTARVRAVVENKSTRKSLHTGLVLAQGHASKDGGVAGFQDAYCKLSAMLPSFARGMKAEGISHTAMLERAIREAARKAGSPSPPESEEQ